MKAVINVDVPEWQIGHDVSICFSDSMIKHGKCLLKEPPGIVRCKNCKHLIDHYGFMDDGYCKKMQDDYNIKLKPKNNWFCADWERL
jgi:hypothetical protein